VKAAAAEAIIYDTKAQLRWRYNNNNNNNDICTAHFSKRLKCA